MKTTIRYCDVPLAVTFDYYAGFAGSHIDPPEPEQAEIESILVGGVDICGIFTQEQLDEIETLILEATASDREEAYAERSRMEREYP